ncbi:hypothetical protein Nepgr_027667 [Nepenthes gracilis]|uniref:Uncharacterized protein n=1 Tax=Nepenthes gracilis TaxID=150966 RepID=A0AAD3TAQ5_NEPGR|nr:hypothetical protein Nepgr_027667 [Nepenthes gracilis]
MERHKVKDTYKDVTKYFFCLDSSPFANVSRLLVVVVKKGAAERERRDVILVVLRAPSKCLCFIIAAPTPSEVRDFAAADPSTHRIEGLNSSTGLCRSPFPHQEGVLPCGQYRSWTVQELEIIEVVADQVAVAISHAAVLEESQLMRDKLVEQHRALQRAKKIAMMASQARNWFLKVIGDGMRRPLHSILGLLSSLQDENFDPEQQLIVDAYQMNFSQFSRMLEARVQVPPRALARTLLFEEASTEVFNHLQSTSSIITSPVSSPLLLVTALLLSHRSNAIPVPTSWSAPLVKCMT